MNNTPKQMKQEGIDEIKNNSKLFSTICELLDVKPLGLVSHLNRNSERLNQYVVVMAVAEAMGVTPDDILEEKEFAKATA